MSSQSVMVQLGPIPFSINTISYQKLQRRTSYRWASQALAAPVWQYLGTSNDTVYLVGTMYPQYREDAQQLDLLRLTASLGKPLPLINGNGVLLGNWLITEVEELDTIFLSNGVPRKISFKLTLQRAYEQSSSV